MSLKSYTVFFKREIKRLDKTLKKAGVKKSQRQRVINSGYMLWPVSLPKYKTGNKEKVVCDGFYGTKWGFGFIPLDEFLNFLRNEKQLLNSQSPHFAPEYHVSDFKEIKKILSQPRHKQFINRCWYRGQLREYSIKRPYPNPNKKRIDNTERIIIPSFWRKYLTNYRFRPFVGYLPILVNEGGDLLYEDFDNWKALEKERKAKHPFFEDFREAVFSRGNIRSYMKLESSYGVTNPHNYLKRIKGSELREYCRKWIKYNCTYHETTDERDLLDQHYGLPSRCLDVTTKVEIADFFSCNKFTLNEDGIADYQSIEKGKNKGVIYCFVFEDPPMEQTKYRIKNISLYSKFPPNRPIKQFCGAPFFGAEMINEASVELDAVFYLTADYRASNEFQKEELFPSPKNDPFYQKLLYLKKKKPLIFSDVHEFTFHK